MGKQVKRYLQNREPLKMFIKVVWTFELFFIRRWSKIARKLPGRTDNKIKNYWRTHMRKKAHEKKKRPMSPASSSSNCCSSSMTTAATQKRVYCVSKVSQNIVFDLQQIISPKYCVSYNCNKPFQWGSSKKSFKNLNEVLQLEEEKFN